MKQFKIAGSLFKCFVLTGLIMACNNDQIVTPTSETSSVAGDRNAKISPLLRLVDDAGANIQYVKSGKFFGQVLKTSDADPTGYRYEYTYNDNNPSGDLWISQKKFTKPSGMFLYETKYKVTNGVCVRSETLNYHKEYKYTANGYLDQIECYENGNKKYTYRYFYNILNRLWKIEFTDMQAKLIARQTFTYTAIPDKYQMPFESDGVNKYLPVFGKLSDVLPDEVAMDWSNPQNLDSKRKFIYTTDSDGLVISKLINYTLNNSPNGSATQSFVYSVNWQGI